MKKFIVFLLVLVLSASFAAAEEEGIGLTAGLEFGVLNVNKANDADMTPYLMPILIYENSFMDDALDIYAELDYTFGFSKEPNDEGDKANPQSIYLDLQIGYNLGLGDTSTLSFILENEFDEIIISPSFKDSNALTGIFTPAVKFNKEFDFGDLFAQIGTPITYIQYYKEADTLIGLDFTFGWDSAFGLGLQAKICNLLVPDDYAGYLRLETIVSYKTESVYVEVETIIPKGIGDEGITITPLFEYFFKNFTFYVKSEFAFIGIDGGNVGISPALGIKYSF